VQAILTAVPALCSDGAATMVVLFAVRVHKLAPMLHLLWLFALVQYRCTFCILNSYNAAFVCHNSGNSIPYPLCE